MWVLQLGRKVGAGLEVGVPLIVIGFLWIGECVHTPASLLWKSMAPAPGHPGPLRPTRGVCVH